jgi:hypothetical protein|tara:strand:+ start:339 stop:1280 length:942 start_codon:yes stop_codon:yes gene_type:complete
MMDTGNSGHLIRSEVWSSQLKEVLEDELQGQGYVNWMNEFPDGTTFTIPSIGQAQTDDYVENDAVQYRALDTGEFQFSVNKYKSSGHYITNKAKQDMYYMNQLVSSFVPKQARAIMETLETDIMALSASQTASSSNSINGASHRFVGTGTNEVITVADFAKARFSLKKANVPDRNLIAIVDPSVEFEMNNITNITNVSNNPRWEGVIASGIASGMSFLANIYGFDVYTSNYLADANEQIDSAGATTAAGKANMFFSADSSVLPFVGAWRQMPQVDSEYNKDKQREEYVTTARYGVALYRPENLVCVLTDTDQV